MWSGRTIALIGGGRWGRVHASNLCELLTYRDNVLWVSRHNPVAIRTAIETQFPADGPRFVVCDSINEALIAQPSAAVIANQPQMHVATTAACLCHGIHTFVEKPLALKAGEATSLIDIAANADLVLALGVHILSASYLHHFKSMLPSTKLGRISVRWFDPVHEVRYGDAKHVDDTIPLAHDVYPHIWSIVRVLTGAAEQMITRASKRVDGSISFGSVVGDLDIDVHCGRNALARERKVSVLFRDGKTASLDFTQEPGVARLARTELSPDPRWGKGPRPAMGEVRDFLAQVFSPARDPKWPHLAVHCLDGVIGAEMLQSKLEQASA